MSKSKLRTLWLFGVTSLAVVGAGCGGGDDDEVGAAFGPEWSLEYVDGTPVSCEAAGTPKVDLDLRTPAGEDLHFMFDCSAFAGLTTGLQPGIYAAAVRLKDKNNRVISEQTGEAELAPGGVTALPVPFVVQSFKLQWAITKAGNIASCDAVGASQVQLHTQVAEIEQMFEFPCKDRIGASPAILTGLYTYQVRLLDAAGKEVARTDARTLDVAGDKRPEIVAEFKL